MRMTGNCRGGPLPHCSVPSTPPPCPSLPSRRVTTSPAAMSCTLLRLLAVLLLACVMASEAAATAAPIRLGRKLSALAASDDSSTATAAAAVAAAAELADAADVARPARRLLQGSPSSPTVVVSNFCRRKKNRPNCVRKCNAKGTVCQVVRAKAVPAQASPSPSPEDTIAGTVDWYVSPLPGHSPLVKPPWLN